MSSQRLDGTLPEGFLLSLDVAWPRFEVALSGESFGLLGDLENLLGGDLEYLLGGVLGGVPETLNGEVPENLLVGDLECVLLGDLTL